MELKNPPPLWISQLLQVQGCLQSQREGLYDDLSTFSLLSLYSRDNEGRQAPMQSMRRRDIDKKANRHAAVKRKVKPEGRTCHQSTHES